jgi:hypothetical protein
MAYQFHALGLGTSFYFEHHGCFELHEPAIRQIKRRGYAGYIVGTEPFVGKPDMRTMADIARRQFFLQTLRATIDECAFDTNFKIAQSLFEQLLVSQFAP